MEWHTVTPTSYGCCLREVDGMESFQLVMERSMTKEEFFEWPDQWAWDNGQEDVGVQVNEWPEELVWWPCGALKKDLCVRVDTLKTVEVDEGWSRLEAFLEGKGPAPCFD